MDENIEQTEDNTSSTEEEIKAKHMIGRDEILKQEVYPRVRRNTGFIITGQKGIGKTEILKWAYQHYQGQKYYISCNDTYGDVIKGIAKKQGIPLSKKTLSQLEKEIMKGNKIALFVDDFEVFKRYKRALDLDNSSLVLAVYDNPGLFTDNGERLVDNKISFVNAFRESKYRTTRRSINCLLQYIRTKEGQNKSQ